MYYWCKEVAIIILTRATKRRAQALFLLTLFVFSGLTLASEPSMDKNKIPYCIDPDWMPYEGIKNGKHVGISSDYLKLISKASKLRFHFIPTSSWSQSLEYLKSGRCHLALMLNKSESREQYLTFSDSYYRSPNVLISLRKQPFLQNLSHIGERKLGVVKEYRMAEYVDKYYPDINKVFVSTESEGIHKVAGGELDVFIGSMLSVNARSQQYGYGNLKIAGWAGPEDELRFGVIKEKESLLPILNQSIQSISEAQRIEIFKKWNNARIIKEFDYNLASKVFAGIFAMMLLFILRQIQLNKFNRALSEKNKELELITQKLENTNKHLEYLSFHDPLTNLYNRHYFSHHVEDQVNALKRSKISASLMLIDIDYFKKVNDQFGHAVGDLILVEISELFSFMMRDADVCGRWGGEEFIIFLPESSLEQAVILSERLQKALAQTKFDPVGNITVSIGVSEYHIDESFQQWFERTDKALYMSKANGRDQTSSS